MTVRERDLRALAAIVSEDRPDLPDGEGLPQSLLTDLISQIRCDSICLGRYDSGPRRSWFLQGFPALTDDELKARHDRDPAQLAHYYACNWTAGPAAIPNAPAMCAASSNSRTSTPRGKCHIRATTRGELRS